MLLGKSHNLFDRAEQAYDRAIHLIRNLDESFQSAAFQNDPEERYDTRVTLYQFDVILQAILLRMALIDGNFHRPAGLPAQGDRWGAGAVLGQDR